MTAINRSLAHEQLGNDRRVGCVVLRGCCDRDDCCPLAAGRPFLVPVDFDPENRSEFACPKTLQIAVKELLPHLELACQGSVVKCAQIFASVMRQIGEPDVLTKIAAFDRFAEALEKLKPPPTGYELFRRAVADEVREDLGDGASLADVEKQIASRWKQLSKA